MKEIWKDIKGYEGHYQISNLGRVKSLSRITTFRGKKRLEKELILREGTSKKGYSLVSLQKNGIAKTQRVHRLVAQAFIPNINNYQQVNHKDENKKNNCVDNLEWCDCKYNNNYGLRTSKISKKVLQIETGIVYPSVSEAYRKTKIDIANISRVCLGKIKTAGGYHWKYI